MKKFLNWLKSYFCNAQLTSEDFARVKPAAAISNHNALKSLSLISTSIFAIMIAIALMANQPFWATKINAYYIAFGASLLAFLLNKFVASSQPKLLWLPMFLLEMGLLGFGLYVTLIAAPQQMSIAIIVILVIIPLLFLQRPYLSWILYVIVDALFIIVAPQVKAQGVVLGEVANVVTFSIVGLLLGNYFLRARFERLLFEDKVNQMDDKELLNKNLKSITDIYVSIHQIDLTTGYFFGLRSNEFIDRALQSNHEDANTQFKYIMCSLTSRDFLTEILDFVNLKTLPDRMKGKRVLTKEFLGNNLGWCRCQFIAQGKVTPTSMPDSVIFTVQEINDEVKART